MPPSTATHADEWMHLLECKALCIKASAKWHLLVIWMCATELYQLHEASTQLCLNRVTSEWLALSEARGCDVHM